MTLSRRAITTTLALWVRELIRSEDGPTAVEYAVMLAMIIVMCISAITLVGGGTFDFWDNNRSELESSFSGP